MALSKSKVSPKLTQSDSSVNRSGAKGAASTRVLRKFRIVFNAVKTHFQQVEKKVGIGGAQIWALSVIYSKPGIGINELAVAMDIHQPTASNLVKALVKSEMVQVEKKGPDKRSVQLYVLPVGQQILSRAPGPFSGVLPDALQQLDIATLERLDKDLGTLLNLISSDEKTAHIPLSQM